MLARNKTASAPSNRKPTTQSSSSRLQTAPLPVRAAKISDRFNKPLGSNKPSAFSSAYAKGLIPCRLIHGSVNHKLGWSIDPSELNFDPMLVTFFDGLIDTRHPYEFLVKTGLKEMLESEGMYIGFLIPGAYLKILPLLPSITRPLRNGLGSREKSVLLTSLTVLSHLATITESSILPILAMILPPLASKLHNCDGSVAGEIMDTLRAIEMSVVESCRNGSGSGDFGRRSTEEDCKRVVKVIKGKVPTYTSVYF